MKTKSELLTEFVKGEINKTGDDNLLVEFSRYVLFPQPDFYMAIHIVNPVDSYTKRFEKLKELVEQAEIEFNKQNP